ncbi:MAG: hypothetical protein QXJ66_07235 [Candidatus Methanomethylicia archaeon]
MQEKTVKETSSTLYGWAFYTGKEIIERFKVLYGEEKAEKRMESLLLTLRSELLPERFRRSLIDSLIEVNPRVGIPEEVKIEKRWTIDEFYRYSTAILSGFFDAMNYWREEKEKESKKKGEEHAK